MKKLLLASISLLFFSGSLMAGTVNLTYATDSLGGNPCQLPRQVMFIMGGNATGYTASDSIDLYIAFGDGTDTSFKSSIWNSSNFGNAVSHTYTLPGQYTVLYVATGPDGASDTIIVPNEIILGTTCGNITGKAYLDNDGDCSFGSGDLAYRSLSVKLKTGGQVVQQTFTDANGDYEFTAVSGVNYDLEVANTLLNPVCPSSGSYSITSLPATNQDFAMECLNSQYDLESSYSGNFIVPGVDRTIYFNVKNRLCTPVSGVAKLVLTPDVTYVPSSSPYVTTPSSINGDTLFFNFNQLTVADNFSIRVVLQGDTTLTVNDSVCLTLITGPTANDADASNNILNQCVEVRTSYDPNMKTVSPAGEGTEGYIRPDQTMIYTIHFQNTGNFMATNIFILDTIDTQTLDLNTLEVLDYSHPMEMRIVKNNILRFNFDNIMLPDSNSNEPESHGYVSFRIAQQPGLAHAATIENTAGIFFDYNPPIITNTAVNTIDVFISIEETEGAGQAEIFQAYPNPSNGMLWVELNQNIGTSSLEIYDLNAKRVLSREINDREQFNLSTLPKGVYILKVSNGETSQQKRMIIQ